jgi:hypothetical protein
VYHPTSPADPAGPSSVPPRPQPTTGAPSFYDILKFQWTDPESKAANTNVAIGLGAFAAAVVFFSQLGDLLVPAL